MKRTDSPTVDWLKKDQAHVWHPYTQMLTAPPAIPIERAQGVYLYPPGGEPILDGISSWWVNIHGHCHPRLNLALHKQIDKLAQVIFAGFTHKPAAKLAGELVRCTPANLTRVFFSDDGSTAVEVALKMAYQYWVQQGEPHRKLFIAFENAFHGDTFGAMSVGNIEEFQLNFSDLLFRVRRARTIRHARQILDQEGDHIAGVIIEPIVQAAGGMIIWPPESLSELRVITKQHGVPLIADEVFTGFGRTGKMFACEHGPIEPDILCLSKALTGGYLPLATTLTSETIYQAFLSENRAEAFLHGHSFTGNALSCAVALESLALFQEEKRLERVLQLENLFRKRLENIREKPLVKKIRGIGALAVIELEPHRKTGYLDERMPSLTKIFLDRNILLRPLGNTLYFLPPYIITDEEVHRVFDVIEEVLDLS